MPSIFPLYTSYRNYIKDVSVIRLHGPDRSNIERTTKGIWNQIVEPKDNELAQLAKMIFELQSDDVDLHIYLNNHYEGSAPKSILRIKELLS